MEFHRDCPGDQRRWSHSAEGLRKGPHVFRTPQVYHTALGMMAGHLSTSWLRKWCWEDGVRGSSSAHVPKAPALLMASSPSIPSTPSYNLHLEGNDGCT